MENRFGLKDLFLFLLLGVLIVLVVFGMKQYDRQWDVIQQTRSKLEEQTTDLARIRRLLEQGGGRTGPSIATNQAADPPADLRVLQSHAAPDYAAGDAVIDTLMVTPDKLTPLVS